MDSSKKIANNKVETYSLFNLPQEILESLKIYSEQIELINEDSLPGIQKSVSDESDIDSTEDSSLSENRKKIRCNKCKLSFNDYQELRNVIIKHLIFIFYYIQYYNNITIYIFN